MHPEVMRSVAVLVAAVLATTAAAQPAPQLPPAVKAAVQARLQAFAQACRADGGRAVSPPSVSTAFLNGDDQADLIYAFDTARCSNWGATNGYCGSMGCAVEVHLSTGGSYRRVADITTPAWKIDRSVRPNRFITQPEGPNGPQRVWGWNGQTFAIAAPAAAGPPAVSPAASPLAAPSPTGFAVTVELSPAAQQWYARRKDRPVLLVIYQGPPKRGTPADLIHPAEDVVVAGEERTPLPVAGGTVRVPGAGLDQDLARWIQGEPEVGLLVGHERQPQSSMDSEQFLECTPDVSPKLSAIRARGARLRCGPPAY